MTAFTARWLPRLMWVSFVLASAWCIHVAILSTWRTAASDAVIAEINRKAFERAALIERLQCNRSEVCVGRTATGQLVNYLCDTEGCALARGVAP